MRITLLLLLAAVSATALGQDSIPSRFYDSLSLQAGTFEQNGDLESALAAVERVHPSDSSYCFARLTRSYYLLNLERYTEAVQVADEGLKDDCGSAIPSLYINKGIGLMQLEEHDKARQVFEDGLSAFPMNAEIWFNKALSLERLQKGKEAAADYQEAILRNPLYGNAWVRLGDLYLKQGRLSQALMCFDIFQLLDPDGDNALRTLKAINDAVSGDHSNPPAADMALSTDDAGFNDIDLILGQRVALSQGYETGNPLDFSIVRQNHALLQQLGNYKGSGDFWEQKVVPLFRWIHSDGQFDPFVYALCYATTNEQYKKIIERNTDEASAFLQEFRNRLVELVRPGTFEIDGAQTPVAYYFSDGYVVGVGVLEGENPKGVWHFYDEKGWLSGIGGFDAQGERHGPWNWYYQDGTLKESAVYEHGVLEGPNTSYFESGKLQLQGAYHKGELHGAYRQYNEYGALLQDKNFENGLLEGMYKEFFQVGETQAEYLIPYVQGKVEGEAIEYFSDGKPYSEMKFQAGLQVGTEINYYPGGQIASTAQYENGNRHGLSESFHPNGQLKEKGQAEEGLNVGPWQSWYPDGTPESRYEMVKGKVDGEYTYFDRDGKRHYTYQYRRGEVIAFTFYDKAGKVLGEGRKKDGEFYYAGLTPQGNPWSEGTYDIKGGRKGLWKYYEDYGLLRETGVYVNDQAQGMVTDFFPDGSVESVSPYVNDSLHGYYRDYHKNGTLKSHGWYIKSQKQGEWKTYYPNGSPETTGYFHKGALHGDQVSYSGAGEPAVINRYEFGTLKEEIHFRKPGQAADTLRLGGEPGRFKRVLYHANGKVKSEFSYLNSVLDGPFSRYDYYGNLIADGAYLNNKEHGAWNRYYPNGQLEISIPFYLGRREGTMKQFHKNGEADTETRWAFDALAGNSESHYDNGQLHVRTAYKDGLEHGRKEFYDTEGHLQLIRYYDHGRLTGYSYLGPDGQEKPIIPLPDATGVIRSFYDNGNPAREMEVFHGYFNNTYREYYYNGQLAQEFSYLYGDYHGTNREFYPDGKPKKVEHFLLDELHGEVIEYHPGGEVSVSANYANGKKNGVSKTFDKEGNLLKTETYFNDAIIEVQQ